MEPLQFTIRTRLGERMVSMNSTLVETVSINYEDFNESFLTCGTCLCMYDGNEHTPKLLQCSHTVCLHCLTKIAASQTRDTGTFRCPICRELITIPRGGVSALPPSFLVNQLLDLMSRQRREVIPKCSVHINQELLFCETCDTVFCTICTNGSHSDTTNSCEHTIIPFSIAIKRMSEILLYKANECISKLTQAQDGVSSELRRLDAAKETCLEQINSTFQHLQSLLDKRKEEIIELLNTTCSEKRRVLEEQHSLIESEKNKVEQECQGLQYQVEVRNITQRIESLTEKLDTASSLGEPRENAFISCDFKQNNSLETIEEQLNLLGRVRTSTTFPSLCQANLNNQVIAGIENSIILSTVDYHGDQRKTGGDPINVELCSVNNIINNDISNNDDLIPVKIVDCDDGIYKLLFRILKPGRYGMRISIFERSIKDCPLYFDVTEHNNPVLIYGSHGSGKDEFIQPVAVTYDIDEQIIYVLDTGNSRIKVLNEDFECLKHITNEGLLGRSCTGLTISNNGLIVVNWRSKFITEMTTDGETIKSFTYNAFQEPIDVAFDKNYGHILVADNGMNCIFVFDSDGKMLFQIGRKGTFSQLSSVTIGPNSEIIVADIKIQIFSAKGDFMEVIRDEGKGKGRYGGVAIDTSGHILASRSEPKGKNYIQLFSLNDTNLNNFIDSHDNKLKRPSGVAVISNNHVVVVDLGNNCIKKYRYW